MIGWQKREKRPSGLKRIQERNDHKCHPWGSLLMLIKIMIQAMIVRICCWISSSLRLLLEEWIVEWWWLYCHSSSLATRAVNGLSMINSFVFSLHPFNHNKPTNIMFTILMTDDDWRPTCKWTTRWLQLKDGRSGGHFNRSSMFLCFPGLFSNSIWILREEATLFQGHHLFTVS